MWAQATLTDPTDLTDPLLFKHTSATPLPFATATIDHYNYMYTLSHFHINDLVMIVLLSSVNIVIWIPCMRKHVF